jgi:hypothetical protein
MGKCVMKESAILKVNILNDVGKGSARMRGK